jgi:seryl-tRNA synthetase
MLFTISLFQMPIDINLLREEKGGNPELVRESQRRRNAKVELVDIVIDLDQRWRKGRRSRHSSC